VARNRSVRVAVLGSSVQRPASSPTRSGSPVRRRVAVVILIAVSLALVTVYFRESSTGSLHRLQDAGTSVLRPFEIAAHQVERPFQDGAHWLSGLVHVRRENARLKAEIDQLRSRAIANESALQENGQLRALLQYRDGPTFPTDYRPLAARVVTRPPSEFDQRIVVSVGAKDGVQRDDPVVTADGLVGLVTNVANYVSEVTLITDESSAVSAIDLSVADPQVQASGLVRHGSGRGQQLILDRVTKDKVVNVGDQIITSGWRLRNLSSLYPKGIPIGRVTSVGQTDTDLYKQIQIAPYVDFSALEAVLVLVPKPGVSGR